MTKIAYNTWLEFLAHFFDELQGNPLGQCFMNEFYPEEPVGYLHHQKDDMKAIETICEQYIDMETVFA